MKALGYVTAFLMWMVVSFIFRGYVLSVLWAWFLVGPFGWPGLSIAHAIGLTLIVSFLTYQTTPVKDNRDTGEKVVAGIASTVLVPAIALLIGWIAKGFMG